MFKGNPLNLHQMAVEQKVKDYQEKIKAEATEILDNLDHKDYTYADLINICTYMQEMVRTNCHSMKLRDIYVGSNK